MISDSDSSEGGTISKEASRRVDFRGENVRDDAFAFGVRGGLRGTDGSIDLRVGVVVSADGERIFLCPRAFLAGGSSSFSFSGLGELRLLFPFDWISASSSKGGEGGVGAGPETFRFLPPI